MAKKKTPPKKAAKKKPAAGATTGAPAVGKLNVVPIDEAKIAELAKMAVGTSKAHLHRARALLRKALLK